MTSRPVMAAGAPSPVNNDPLALWLPAARAGAVSAIEQGSPVNFADPISLENAQCVTLTSAPEPLSPSPRPAGYPGPVGAPVPGRDRQALCQQHCGFFMQSTWCVGHAGTEAACAAVPVSITVGPAAKAVASAAEASAYGRAARGRPCFRLIDFPFRSSPRCSRPGWGLPFRGGGCFRHSLAGAA